MSNTSNQPELTAIGDAERPGARRELFIASFTLLFFELACIRWFGSMVIFLTFFTNLVLLASFLGMSIGCLSAHSKRDFSAHTLTLALTGDGAGLGHSDGLHRV